MACAVHGRCSPETQIKGVPWCITCPDYEPGLDRFPGPPVRNLLYHVYPRKGNGRWQWNVRQVLRRIDLFNGRRVVAIAVDGTTDSAEEVQAAFGGHVREFVVMHNDPSLREVATFEALFSRVDDPDPLQATLWAHAKSVTRRPEDATGAWTEMLCEGMLDYWPVVEEQLERHPVTGAFRTRGRFWPQHSTADWAYAGSWFWFRNRHLFSRPDWRRIDRFWPGIELYPALHFSWDEAGCLFCEHPGNLYDWNNLRTAVLPEFERWAVRNAPRRTRYAC
jgi:hypothetical protein